MTEQETVQRAIDYLTKLASGINPLNGAEIPEGETLREPRISRCLEYAAGKLGSLMEYRENSRPTKDFFILDVQREALETSKVTVTTTQLAEKINRVTEENETKKFQARWLLDWLTAQSLLELRDGRRYTTEAGKLLGITVEPYTNPVTQAVVYSVRFTTEAQQFVFDNLAEIVGSRAQNSSSKSPRKPAFYITELQKGQLSPLPQSCSVSQLAAEINRVTEENETLKFKPAWINSWLLQIGMLENRDGDKIASLSGNALGISSSERTNECGTYIANSYTPEAQSFILDNLDAVLACAAEQEEQAARK